MSRQNQAWADDVTATSTDSADSRRLGQRRLQEAYEVLDGVGASAAEGERTWIYVAHEAAEAAAWAQGNSIVRATDDNEWDGILCDAAAPSNTRVLGLAQFSFPASTLTYGFIGRTGAFDGLSDGTLDDAEVVVATNNVASGRVAGVAVTASIGSHIGWNLANTTVASGSLGSVMLTLS